MSRFYHAIFNSPDQVQIILFVFILFISWNIELFAGISKGYKKWSHAFLNAKFIFSNIPVQFFIGIIFTFVIKWTALHHFGLLHFFTFNNHGIEFIISFAFLDFGEYIYHVLMHRIKRFWMFHIVHHSDLHVDVSTSLREHPGENLIRNSFTILWLILIGAPFWIFFLRLIIQTASNVFAHLNYQLPEKLDKLIGLVFITPNLHHVHHHFKQPYTDCNFGDVFSIWDRLFGTFCRMPYSKIVFGVDTLMDKEKNTKYSCLFKIPFSEVLYGEGK